jgi:hypothetical protein
MTNPNGEKYVGEWQDGKFIEMAAGGSYPDLKDYPSSEDDIEIGGVGR